MSAKNLVCTIKTAIEFSFKKRTPNKNKIYKTINENRFTTTVF